MDGEAIIFMEEAKKGGDPGGLATQSASFLEDGLFPMCHIDD